MMGSEQQWTKSTFQYFEKNGVKVKIYGNGIINLTSYAGTNNVNLNL